MKILLLILGFVFQPPSAFAQQSLALATVNALTLATLQSPPVAQHLQSQVQLRQPSLARPVRALRRHELSFRASLPQGVGVSYGFNWAAPLQTAVVLASTGATASVTAEATLNILWNENLTPTITIAFSNVHFTGLADNIARDFIHRIYGTDMTVTMSGRYLFTISAMGGLDWMLPSGLHLFGRAGIVQQLGPSFGGDDSLGSLNIYDWFGLATEIGMGGAF